MTPDEIREGRELAMRATQGVWLHDKYHVVFQREGTLIATCASYVENSHDDSSDANAAYIAHFHPARVLELLALAEEALRAREGAK